MLLLEYPNTLDLLCGVTDTNSAWIPVDPQLYVEGKLLTVFTLDYDVLRRQFEICLIF